jgi:hypothetical protein
VASTRGWERAGYVSFEKVNGWSGGAESVRKERGLQWDGPDCADDSKGVDITIASK